MSEQQEAKNQPKSDAAADVVAPVESAKSAPKSAPVQDNRPERLAKCWNCKKRLDENGICPKCGFDVNQVYNAYLETDKRRHQEQLAAQGE